MARKDYNTDFEVCANCGAVIEDTDTAIEHDGLYLCCEDCAHDAGLELCNNCGEWYDRESEEAVDAPDGANFCCFECAHEEGYEVCEECGEWFDASCTDTVFELRGDIHIFCDDTCAARGGYVRCDDCGEWVDREDTWLTAEDRIVCEDCLEDNYFYCDGCDEWHSTDYYGGSDGYAAFCEDCWSERRGVINGYHDAPPLRFYGSPAPEDVTIGFELEVDGGSDANACAQEIEDAVGGYLYFEEDGSLSCDGFEIISQPATYDYIVGSKVFETISEIARDNGYTSHDARTCGLHFHIGRKGLARDGGNANREAYMLATLIDRHEREFIKFSRRTNQQMSWCKTKGRSFLTAPDLSTSEKIERMDYNERSERYQAVNTRNRATVELRLMRGTLRVETLYASLALVNSLALWCKRNLTERAETVTWPVLVRELLELCPDTVGRGALVNYLAAKQLIDGFAPIEDGDDYDNEPVTEHRARVYVIDGNGVRCELSTTVDSGEDSARCLVADEMRYSYARRASHEDAYTALSTARWTNTPDAAQMLTVTDPVNGRVYIGYVWDAMDASAEYIALRVGNIGGRCS